VIKVQKNKTHQAAFCRVLTCICVLVWISHGHAFAEDRGLSVSPLTPMVPEKRTALIIGNGAYKDSPLANPANDARDIAIALSGLGFKVILKEDVSQRNMKQVIREFGNELKQGGVGLFYFAGHGMQLKGRNYIIPIDAEVQGEDEIEDQSVDVNLVLDKMESAKNRVNIVILDACRNNPFQRAFRSTNRGLAQMDASKGFVIAYATAPGSIAADGTGKNGIYTKHLLKSLKYPDTAIESVFKRVRAAVLEESRGKQIPWEASSLVGDFYFNPNAASGYQSKAGIKVTPGPEQESPLAAEIAFWNSIQKSSHPLDYESYLKRYPNGQFIELAHNRLESLKKRAQENPIETLADKDSVSSQKKATIYFFRRSRFIGSAIDYTVAHRNKIIGTISSGSYFIYYAPPGEFLFSVQGFSLSVAQSFDMEPGKTYYVELDVGFTSIALRMVDNEDGANAVKDLKK